jgi:tRNA threonylcarbamoyladenosine biosynthesis protein TsaB
MNAAGLEVALETSSLQPSVAARAAGRLLESGLSGSHVHASDLLPALARLLEDLGVGPAAIGTVFVGTGPGSYTGLRVGIATALGLARGSGAALFGVPSLEVLAWDALADGQSGAFVLDARQGELYLAAYRRAGAGLVVLRAPCVIQVAELAGTLEPGQALHADESVLAAAGLTVTGATRALRAPRAGALLELGAQRMAREGPQQPAALEPLYLRPFAARPRRR